MKSPSQRGGPPAQYRRPYPWRPSVIWGKSLLGRVAHVHLTRGTVLIGGLLLLIAVVASFPPNPAQGDDSPVSAEASRARHRILKLSVMTWNVHQPDDKDQEIADVIFRAVGQESGRLGIAALQEMCFKNIAEVVVPPGRLAPRSGRDWSFWDSYWGEFRDLDDKCVNGNALVVSREQPHTVVPIERGPDRNEIPIKRKAFEVQDPADCRNRGAPEKNAECRNYVRVDVVLRGARIRVYSTHMDDDNEPVRAQQIRELFNDIREEGAPRIPRIVMGDFNVSRNNLALVEAMRAERFRDVLDTLDEDAPRGTVGAGPCPAPGDRRVDFILVRRLSIQSARVQPLSDDQNPSDHCPVVANLRIRI